MIAHAHLKEILHYDPKTGVFTWISKISRKTNIGAIAGSIGAKGYRKIRIRGKYYRANRLAWFYMTGEWPNYEIDHRNRIRHDDSWSNLRDVTSKMNKANAAKRIELYPNEAALIQAHLSLF